MGSPLPLRVRVAVAFGLVSAMLTALVAVVTFKMATSYMTNQRETSATRQAIVNARLVESTLRHDRSALADLVTGLGSDVELAVLVMHGSKWTSSENLVDLAQLPSALEEMVTGGQAARQRVVLDGVPVLAVGIPLTTVGASYFEAFPLRELDRTFRFLAWMLAVAVAAAALAGAALGRWVAARSLRPLVGITAAAAAVADGDLSARMPRTRDRDLRRLAAAFNDTVEQLAARVRQDARFASDVSHELRSPLTTILNAVAVLQHRENEMSPDARRALLLLTDELRRFHSLVEDLLEISRHGEDGAAINPEPVDLGELVRQTASRQGVPAEFVHTEGSGPQVVADRRLMERIVVNLIDNASAHGGGVTRIATKRVGDAARIEVEDTGPGVPPADRTRIFERFARSKPSAREQAYSGTGLGLAIVLDHVQRHRGRTWVEDSPTGGACFVVELAVAP